MDTKCKVVVKTVKLGAHFLNCKNLSDPALDCKKDPDIFMSASFCNCQFHRNAFPLSGNRKYGIFCCTVFRLKG